MLENSIPTITFWKMTSGPLAPSRLRYRALFFILLTVIADTIHASADWYIQEFVKSRVSNLPLMTLFILLEGLVQIID